MMVSARIPFLLGAKRKRRVSGGIEDEGGGYPWSHYARIQGGEQPQGNRGVEPGRRGAQSVRGTVHSEVFRCF